MIGDRPIAEIPVSGPVRLDPSEGGPDPVNPLAAQLLPERVAATSRSCRSRPPTGI